MFGGLGGPEIIIILVIALIIFGPDKLPELARGIGKGIREFRHITGGVERTLQDEFNAIMKEDEAEKASPPATNNKTDKDVTSLDEKAAKAGE